MLDEALAIEQARQLVVLGHVEDAALCLLLPGDVLENRHEMLHLADRLPDRARRLLRVDLVGPRAVQHGLAPPRLTGARTLPQHRAEPEAGGGGQHHGRRVDTIAGVQPGQPGEGGIGPVEHAVDVGDADRIGRGLECRRLAMHPLEQPSRLGDVEVQDHGAGALHLAGRGHVAAEPALHGRRVARVLEDEAVGSTLQHIADAVGGCRRAGDAAAHRSIADVEVIGADGVVGGYETVVATECLPRRVDRHDDASPVEQGDVGLDAVEGRLLPRIQGPQRLLGHLQARVGLDKWRHIVDREDGPEDPGPAAVPGAHVRVPGAGIASVVEVGGCPVVERGLYVPDESGTLVAQVQSGDVLAEWRRRQTGQRECPVIEQAYAGVGVEHHQARADVGLDARQVADETVDVAGGLGRRGHVAGFGGAAGREVVHAMLLHQDAGAGARSSPTVVVIMCPMRHQSNG